MENNHLKLSQSLEDYLEMVHMLRLANGIARVKDIAAALSVKMPSVAKAILELKKLGLVTQEPYSGVELTDRYLYSILIYQVMTLMMYNNKIMHSY